MSKFINIFIFLLTVISVFGQESTKDIVKTLEKERFYNIAVFIENDTLYISYENKLYLNEIKGIEKVFKSAQNRVPENVSTFILIATSNYIPIAQTIIEQDSRFIDSEKFRMTSSMEIDDRFWKKIKPKLFKQNLYIYDIAIHPELKTQLGNFDDPLKFQFNIAPMLNLSLWQGMLFSTQIVFPIHNELHTYDGDYIRPGLISLSQAFRLPNNYFGVASLGRFSLNRYGANLNFRKYYAKQNIYLGIETGYTGKMAYREGAIYSETISSYHLVGQLGYFIPSHNLLIDVNYGQFLFGDVSWKIALERKFNNIDISFFGVYSKGVKNVGIHLNIPIYPIQTNHINIHTARTFQYEHFYNGHQFEGYLHQTNYSLKQLDRLLLPQLQNHIVKNKIGTL